MTALTEAWDALCPSGLAWELRDEDGEGRPTWTIVTADAPRISVIASNTAPLVYARNVLEQKIEPRPDVLQKTLETIWERARQRAAEQERYTKESDWLAAALVAERIAELDALAEQLEEEASA